MEEYNQLSENGTNTATWANFLFASPVLAQNNNNSSVDYSRTSSVSNMADQQQQPPQLHMNNAAASSSFHLQSGHRDICFDHQSDTHRPAVKIEGSDHHGHKFHYPVQIIGNPTVQSSHQHGQVSNESLSDVEAIKAKIIAHNQYSKVLAAYMDLQKVGAPPEVVAKLAAARQEFENRQRSSANSRDATKDPELDQFMEAYYGMLVKYREEVTRPIQEAMDFMRRIESQLNMLGTGPVRIFNSDGKCEGAGSSEEDQDNSGEKTELPEINLGADQDRELKKHLLRKYSGYLSSLKQELSKKKKKGKLPKDARQKLLTWWELHYKWPYPSEAEKVALAESTGLEQKQINNWFINQRKRHWTPSEDMQFMVMDCLHPHNTAFYMDG